VRGQGILRPLMNWLEGRAVRPSLWGSVRVTECPGRKATEGEGEGSAERPDPSRGSGRAHRDATRAVGLQMSRKSEPSQTVVGAGKRLVRVGEVGGVRQDRRGVQASRVRSGLSAGRSVCGREGGRREREGGKAI
jgi:hypothetical protein